MENLAKVLVGLAAVAFVLAAVGSLSSFSVMGLVPEGLSRACTNLALLGIALSMVFKDS